MINKTKIKINIMKLENLTKNCRFLLIYRVYYKFCVLQLIKYMLE